MSGAVKKMTDGSLIKFDIEHRIRWVYGRQLGIAGVNGGYSYIAVFHHNNRLYELEAKALLRADRRKSTPCVSSNRSISREPDEPATEHASRAGKGAWPGGALTAPPSMALSCRWRAVHRIGFGNRSPLFTAWDLG